MSASISECNHALVNFYIHKILILAGVAGSPVGVIAETVVYQMCQRTETPVRTVQILHHIRDELAICLFLLPAPVKALQVQLVL